MQSVKNHSAATSRTVGTSSIKDEKEGISPGIRVFIRVVVVLVVIALIAGVLGTALYAWVIYLAEPYEEKETLHFTVEDGNHKDATHGCFFLIRAGKGVNIDPYEYSFYLSEKGHTPKKLDMRFREYEDTPPYGPDPNSGDLNKSYEWRQDGELWTEGEYVGFDMPTEDMGVKVHMGVYEVTIKNPRGEIIFKDTFLFGYE